MSLWCLTLLQYIGCLFLFMGKPIQFKVNNLYCSEGCLYQRRPAVHPVLQATHEIGDHRKLTQLRIPRFSVGAHAQWKTTEQFLAPSRFQLSPHHSYIHPTHLCPVVDQEKLEEYITYWICVGRVKITVRDINDHSCRAMFRK